MEAEIGCNCESFILKKKYLFNRKWDYYCLLSGEVVLQSECDYDKVKGKYQEILCLWSLKY